MAGEFRVGSACPRCSQAPARQWGDLTGSTQLLLPMATKVRNLLPSRSTISLAETSKCTSVSELTFARARWTEIRDWMLLLALRTDLTRDRFYTAKTRTGNPSPNNLAIFASRQTSLAIILFVDWPRECVGHGRQKWSDQSRCRHR